MFFEHDAASIGEFSTGFVRCGKHIKTLRVQIHTSVGHTKESKPGNNAAVAGRLLDRLEFLQRLGLSDGATIPSKTTRPFGLG